MRSRLIVSFVAVLVVAGGFTTTAMADTPAPVTTRVDEGLLRLHLGTDSDRFQFDTAGDPEPSTQAIGGGCPITLGAPALVTLTGGKRSGSPAQSISNVGLKNDGLGIKFLNCGKVDLPDWELRLKLGSAIETDPSSGEVAVDYAEIEVEGFLSVRVIADLYRNGILQATQQLSVSGTGTNARMIIGTLNDTTDTNVLFDEIRLRPKSLLSAFSLEGGAEGVASNRGPLGVSLGTDDTLLRVVRLKTFEDGLDCGETQSQSAPGDGSPFNATITRTDGDPDNPACVDIPYSIEFDRADNAVDLLKDDAVVEAQNATFTFTIVWPPEPAPPTTSLDPTTIDIGDGGGPQNARFCNGTPAAPSLPGTFPWCVVSQEIVSAGTGMIQVNEVLFGAGDPRFKR